MHVRILVAIALAAPLVAHAQQSDTVAPPEALAPDGVPPIPRALVDAIRPYTEYRAAGLADWHPTRRELLIATRFANTPQIHRVRMPGGARTQLTFFDEPVTFATYQPRTGAYFLFTKDVGGNEFGQIYRYDVATRRSVRLTREDRSQNGGIRWSHAGDRIAYGSTRRNGADRDLYVMDPADTTSDRLLLQVQGGGWGVADWSPDDRRLVAQEYLSVNRSRLWLVDAASGAKAELAPGSPRSRRPSRMTLPSSSSGRAGGRSRSSSTPTAFRSCTCSTRGRTGTGRCAASLPGSSAAWTGIPPWACSASRSRRCGLPAMCTC
jgi:hypothetical protein